MRAYRGQPGIFSVSETRDRRADLEVKGLCLNFGGVTAISNVDLSVSTGDLVAVIGPNGAGKTSLLNCITGFYRPTSGRILFNDTDLAGLPTHSLTRLGIGRTFQNIELFPGMSVLDNMLLARHVHCRYSLGPACLFWPSVKKEEIYHRRILEEIIDFLEIQSVRKELVGSLPYGMRKRVELGRALALEPKLLVLDEPFAGMTLEEKEDMVRFLVEMNEAWGQTMILVEHDMSIIMSISKRIMVLNFGGKLAEGIPEEIQCHPEVIRAYLGETTDLGLDN
ncbi:MAG: ABC transporter ATP-binding protein [Thermodesulfobacteriota bacterium]|nr:ABC transporter ATP-binding protein [Thermodesulfobacteriota bacterium]